MSTWNPKNWNPNESKWITYDLSALPLDQQIAWHQAQLVNIQSRMKNLWKQAKVQKSRSARSALATHAAKKSAPGTISPEQVYAVLMAELVSLDKQATKIKYDITSKQQQLELQNANKQATSQYSDIDYKNFQNEFVDAYNADQDRQFELDLMALREQELEQQRWLKKQQLEQQRLQQVQLEQRRFWEQKQLEQQKQAEQKQAEQIRAATVAAANMQPLLAAAGAGQYEQDAHRITRAQALRIMALKNFSDPHNWILEKTKPTSKNPNLWYAFNIKTRQSFYISSLRNSLSNIVR